MSKVDKIKQDRLRFSLPVKKFFHEIFSRIVYDPHKVYFVRSDEGFTQNHFNANKERIREYTDPDGLLDVVEKANLKVNNFQDIRYRKAVYVIVILVIE